MLNNKPKDPTFSSARGFTLLEILLAIAILGVAVTVIMQQFSAGLRIARTSQTYTTATIYAKQLLEEYQLAEEMEEAEASGTFDDGYTWRVSIEAYEDYMEEAGAGEEDQEIYELTATIQYDLWQNVLSRIEFRWDHAADGSSPYDGEVEDEPGSLKNSYILMANIAYKF